jgi:hypothetical protein
MVTAEMGCALAVGVRALGRILAGWCGALEDFDFEVDGQMFRRVASGVVAGLIFQVAVDGVLTGLHGMERANGHADGEVAGVNVERLVWGKGKGHVFAGRVADLGEGDVGGGVHFKGGGNEEFGFRRVGVDVIAGSDAEVERDDAGFATGHGDGVDGRDGDGRGLLPRRLGEGESGADQECEEEWLARLAR